MCYGTHWLKSGGRSPVFQEMGRLTVGELPVCRTCPLRAFCVRCHGLALNEEGDLRMPALANCRGTLVRRQVSDRAGALPRTIRCLRTCSRT